MKQFLLDLSKKTLMKFSGIKVDSTLEIRNCIIVGLKKYNTSILEIRSPVKEHITNTLFSQLSETKFIRLQKYIRKLEKEKETV